MLPVPSAAEAGPGRSLEPALRVSDAEEAEFRAASYYEAGYHCGESVLKAVNEVAGLAMPAEFIRLSSGFCEGLGGSRCICGALAGGVMALGLLGGRTEPGQRWEPSYYASAELRQRWAEDQNAESCDEVVKRIGGMHLPERWAHCTLLVGRTARWTLEIAEKEGLLGEGK